MFLKDLFFPKFCLGCGYVGAYLCYSCQNKLKPINQDVCLYCKKPSLFGLTHMGCRKNFNVDGLISLYYYNPILKMIIKNIKYRLATEVWQEFYKIIRPDEIEKLGFYRKLSPDFVIQPIPLTKNKYNERGFNQAFLMAKFFQKFVNFPIVDLLVRKKETSAQAQAGDKRKRYLNIKGAFAINPECRGVIHHALEIILIDDVVTSGSTIKEATRVLKKTGVKKVYVLALSKG